MEDERVISFERGKQLADQLGVEFFETSAKDNINVKVSKYLSIRRLLRFAPSIFAHKRICRARKANDRVMSAFNAWLSSITLLLY